MAEIYTLVAEQRKHIGTGPARALRRSGFVPAVVYGHKQNISFSLPRKEMSRLYLKSGFWSTLFDLNIEGTSYRALAQAVQVHPVTDEIMHIDFSHIGKDAKVKVHVHFNFTHQDKCIGIKRGGILNIIKRSVDVMCSPDHIPHHIDIDISNLQIGYSIHIGDITLPYGVEFDSHQHAEDTVASLVGRVEEEEDTAAPTTDAS